MYRWETASARTSVPALLALHQAPGGGPSVGRPGGPAQLGAVAVAAMGGSRRSGAGRVVPGRRAEAQVGRERRVEEGEGRGEEGERWGEGSCGWRGRLRWRRRRWWRRLSRSGRRRR